MTTILRFNQVKPNGIYRADRLAMLTMEENDVQPKPGHQSYDAETVHGEHLHYSATDAAQRLSYKTKEKVWAEMYDDQNRLEVTYYLYPGTLTLQTGAACLKAARKDLGEDLGGYSVTDLLADNFTATLVQCKFIAEAFERDGVTIHEY